MDDAADPNTVDENAAAGMNDTDERLPGAKSLGNLYDHGSLFADAINSESNKHENEAVKKQIETAAAKLNEVLDGFGSTYSEQYPDYDPIAPEKKSMDAAEQEDAEEDQDRETEGDSDDVKTEKRARRIRWKSMGKFRRKLALHTRQVGKRLEKLKTKAAGTLQLITKGLTKKHSGMITKAADFLAKAEDHNGDWGETNQALAGKHAKALKSMCMKSADAGTDDANAPVSDEVGMKALRDELTKSKELVNKANREIDLVNKTNEGLLVTIKRLRNQTA